MDDLHVGVGKSDDDSLERVRAISSPKLRVFETEWDLSQREGGRLLSDQTNLALARCDGDWCFCLQADEVLHEDDYDIIRDAMRSQLNRKRVLGLWFDYLHFRGDYDIRNALGYRSSVRIIRPGYGLRSIRDASKFGWSHTRPLFERRPWSRTKRIHARIFHYGHVRPPPSMSEKRESSRRLYDGGDLGAARPDVLAEWQYNFAACVPYRGTHPAVMTDLIGAKDWETPPFEPIPLWRNSTFIVGRLRKAGLWPKRRTG